MRAELFGRPGSAKLDVKSSCSKKMRRKNGREEERRGEREGFGLVKRAFAFLFSESLRIGAASLPRSLSVCSLFSIV